MIKKKKSFNISLLGKKELKKISEEIIEISENIKDLAMDMANTMYSSNGVGLAAPQIGKNLRIFVIDTSKKKNDLKIFINPKIISMKGMEINEEGCISIPGIYAEVPRATEVEIEAFDVDGKKFKLKAEGLLAIAIQHENDHLNGKLFIDYLSKTKLLELKSELDKIKCKEN